MTSWNELRTKTMDSIFKGLEITRKNFYDSVYKDLIHDAQICGECDAETLRLSFEMYEDIPENERRLPTFDDFFNGLNCVSSLLNADEFDEFYYDLLNSYQYGYDMDMMEARYEREQRETEDEEKNFKKSKKKHQF